MSAYAEECKIGLTRSTLDYSKYIREYMHEIILKTYNDLGLNCTMDIIPEKRLEELEKKGKTTVTAVRMEAKYLKKFYFKYPVPIAKDIDVLYIGSPNEKNKNIGVIRGTLFQEELSRRLNPDAKIIYVNSMNALLSMFDKNRINGFYILPSYLAHNLNNTQRIKIQGKSSKVTKVSFFHFIKYSFLKKHPKILEKLDILNQNENFNFQDFINKKKKKFN